MVLCRTCRREEERKRTKQRLRKTENIQPKRIEEVLPKFGQKTYTAHDFERFHKMEIGKLVQETLPELLQSSTLTEMEVKKLQTADYSKLVFDIGFPILIKINHSHKFSDLRIDHNGQARYYKKSANYNGSQYFITSQWYAKNKDQYIKWLGRVH